MKSGMGLSRTNYEMFSKLSDMIKPTFCIRSQKITKTIVSISAEFISPLLHDDYHGCPLYFCELVLIEFLYVHRI